MSRRVVTGNYSRTGLDDHTRYSDIDDNPDGHRSTTDSYHVDPHGSAGYAVGRPRRRDCNSILSLACWPSEEQTGKGIHSVFGAGEKTEASELNQVQLDPDPSTLDSYHTFQQSASERRQQIHGRSRVDGQI